MTPPIISVIIPFYRKMALFRQALPQNRIFLDPRVEVIICLDENSEESDLLHFLQHKPGRFKVIVNDVAHDWRPPCRAINVGIRHTQGTFIAVMSPESMFQPSCNEDVFRKLQAQTSGRFFFTGHLTNVEFGTADLHYDEPLFSSAMAYRVSVIKEPPTEGYGFILLPKKVVETMHGFDESRQGYGRDDDDFRIRLRMLGCQEICDPTFQIIHMWHHGTKRGESSEPYAKAIILDEQPNWGTDFNRVAYDTTSPRPHCVQKRRKLFTWILRAFKPIR